MKSEAESDESDGWTDVAAAAPSALSASPSPTDGSGWSEAAANGATPILTEQASESGDEWEEWDDLVWVFKSATDNAAADDRHLPQNTAPLSPLTVSMPFQFQWETRSGGASRAAKSC